MRHDSFSKRRIIHTFVMIFVLVMVIIISMLLIMKYDVEGEQNLPFEITKLNIISTAESDITQDSESKWHADIMQKNNIFLVIEKNSQYKKEEIIKNVKFENFQVAKSNENMEVDLYRPTTSISTYEYSDEYKVQNELEYTGGQNTNTETLQINNQGGVIGFSITSKGLGEYIFDENEKLPSDGRLLAKVGVNSEDIKFTVSFDLIIETESEHKFRTNITLDLPTGNILEEGVGTLEDTELKDIIFKRF